MILKYFKYIFTTDELKLSFKENLLKIYILYIITSLGLIIILSIIFPPWPEKTSTFILISMLLTMESITCISNLNKAKNMELSKNKIKIVYFLICSVNLLILSTILITFKELHI